MDENAAGIGGDAGRRDCTRFIAISWTIENPIEIVRRIA